MNLTDLERELDAACGGNSLPRCKFQGNWPEPCAVCIVCQNAHDRLKRIGELVSNLDLGRSYSPNSIDSKLDEILRLCGVNHET